MSNVTLTNKTYDRLKHITQIVLPGIGSLYAGLAVIWGLPHGEEVVGSIALVTTFCGITLGVSNKNYKNVHSEVDGQIVIQRTEGKKLYALELTGDPHDLEDQQTVVFQVVDEEKQFWDPSQE